jgi:hypothetical protein
MNVLGWLRSYAPITFASLIVGIAAVEFAIFSVLNAP